MKVVKVQYLCVCTRQDDTMSALQDVAQVTAYYIFDAFAQVPVEQLRSLVKQLSVSNVLDLVSTVQPLVCVSL